MSDPLRFDFSGFGVELRGELTGITPRAVERLGRLAGMQQAQEVAGLVHDQALHVHGVRVDRVAALQTRIDRKYVVAADAVERLVAGLDAHALVARVRNQRRRRFRPAVSTGQRVGRDRRRSDEVDVAEFCEVPDRGFVDDTTDLESAHLAERLKHHIIRLKDEGVLTESAK